MKRGSIMGLIQAGFVVGVILIAMFFTRTLQPDPAPARSAERPSDTSISVRIAQTPAVQYAPTVSLTGTVIARTQVAIAPQVSGRVVTVSRNMRPGADVKKGDLLFAIDPADYELAIDRARADVAAATSDLAREEAEAQLARREWRELFPDREITDLAARVPQLAAAEARLQSAEASVATAELNLSRTRVTAPFDARIIDTTLDVGQVFGANQTAGMLYALDGVEISIPASEGDLASIPNVLGSAVIVKDRLGRQQLAEAVIDRAGANVDARTQLRTYYATGDALADLTVGQFVTVEVIGTDPKQALELPASAFTERDRVWVNDGGTLSSRIVRIFRVSSERVVVEPFDIADGVIAVPPSNARDGLAISTRAFGGTP